VSSSHGVVATVVDGAPVPCLQEEGRPKPPPFLLEAVKNSLAESSIMDCSGDGGPLCGEPTKVAP
jgi:hypothetical protein